MSLCIRGQVANPFGNALIPDMTADASVEEIDGTFYCYATTDGYGRGLKTSGPPVVWTSRNFVDWSFSGTYFPSAVGQLYWAPSKTVSANGKYYIYPTINGYIYPAVADSPLGPFRLAKGKDEFCKPFTASTLLPGPAPGGIDAEIFIDDDGQAYAYWGRYHVAKLKDMVSIDSIRTIKTPHSSYYSEGPIFFKRKGIYYYLYTLDGDERYHYAYVMSRESPLGPWTAPHDNIIAKTDYTHGVYGPGHGCVFSPDGTDDWYFVYLEFSRRSTNRQTYVNRMEFNDDGTIKPVELNLNGVGAIGNAPVDEPIKVKAVTASSTASPEFIRPMKDTLCKRTEYFVPQFAVDQSNGSRWMSRDDDALPTLTIDLGSKQKVKYSRIYFVRPTAGHSYKMECSADGKAWTVCGGHSDLRQMSPHVDEINKEVRFLRVTITGGVKGVWEWKVYAPENHVWGQWQEWGDIGNCTYVNPVIPADFSDIDCIKVGNDYYAISSTMQFSPGMTILHSRDLVNWEYAGNAITDLTHLSPRLGWQQMNCYGRGVWAGTLRYHNERFYIFFGTPDDGYFMTSAEKVEGPWEPATCLLHEPGWDDCTALWDDDGRAYFVGTCFADGYKTYLFDMSSDGQSIDRRSARLVNSGNGREANKLIKVGVWYYLVFSEYKSGVGRYVKARRSSTATGPYNEERQLALPSVEANEPNQGGIIEGPDGKWYFLTHHGTGSWEGRAVSLLPVEWKDGWPVIGMPNADGIGQMVWNGQMPAMLSNKLSLKTNDDFSEDKLGPQWQWNYQPREDKFSLSERKGWLRLHAFMPLQENDLVTAGNTLTQRCFRTVHNKATIRLDVRHMADGQHVGLCHFSKNHAALGLFKTDGEYLMEYRCNGKVDKTAVKRPRVVYLRSEWGLDGRSQFSYSLDGKRFIFFGGPYQLSWGYYRGDRIGIYCFNDEAESGYADVDYMRYDYR